MFSDRDDDYSSLSVCADCKGQPKKGRDLILSVVCAVSLHAIVECQRKEWDFHQFACWVVDKRPGTKDV